jgi:hypothetical protein
MQGDFRGSLRTRWKKRENDKRRESKRRGNNGRTESEAQIPTQKVELRPGGTHPRATHMPTRDQHSQGPSLSLPSLPFLGLIGLQPPGGPVLSLSGHFPSQTRDEASTGAAPSERSSSFKLKLSLPVSFHPPEQLPPTRGPSVDRRATGAAASQTPMGNLNLRLRGGSKETRRLEWNLIAKEKKNPTHPARRRRLVSAPCRARGPCVALTRRLGAG